MKTNIITLRVDGTDRSRLTELSAAAARSRGKTFIHRSAIIRAALEFAASNITAFTAYL